MRQYISKITRIGLFMLVMCVCVAGGTGYIHSKSSTIPINGDYVELETAFETLNSRFDSEGYLNVINVVSKMGDKKALTETTEKYDAHFPSKNWQENFDILFGGKELQMLVSQRVSREGNEDLHESAPIPDIAFPDIQLLGMTCLKSKKKVSSVLAIDGRIEIWMWTQNAGIWDTDSFIPGYMVQAAHVGEDKILLTLCALIDVRAQKEYTFDVSSTMSDLVDHHDEQRGLPQNHANEEPDTPDI